MTRPWAAPAAVVFAAALVALVVLIAPPASAAPEDTAPPGTKPFLKERETGWFWYRDPPPRQQSEAPPAPVAPAAPPEIAAYERFKKDMEEARIVAIMTPTAQNLERYIALRTRLVNMSSEFADVGMRVTWANPQYDFTLQRPVTSVGVAAYESTRNETRRETFERLARTSVLYFFFRSDCPYCHAFAPVLHGLAQATGMTIFPVSLDGAGLPDFPAPHLDNGAAAKLNVTTVPALFLAEPANGRIVPVGFGVMAESQLIERLVALANPGDSPFVDHATPVRPLPDNLKSTVPLTQGDAAWPH